METNNVVEQNFQSKTQLLALKVHKILSIVWDFVTYPITYVKDAFDSTPTDPDQL